MIKYITICKNELDLLFFKNYNKNKANNNVNSFDFTCELFIANKQFPVVFYVHDDGKIYHSNMEYYLWRADHRTDHNQVKLINISVLKRKEKLKKLKKIEEIQKYC